METKSNWQTILENWFRKEYVNNEKGNILLNKLAKGSFKLIYNESEDIGETIKENLNINLFNFEYTSLKKELIYNAFKEWNNYIKEYRLPNDTGRNQMFIKISEFRFLILSVNGMGNIKVLVEFNKIKEK